jgi:soluble lytic murein transglycosylase-like protein
MGFVNENAYDSLIQRAAQDQRLQFGLIKAVIARESNFVARAYRAEPSVNDASYGLMQLLYSTARGLGFRGTTEQLFDPQTNINLGALFLEQLVRTASNAGWGVDSAVSAYNAGFSHDRPGDGKRDTDRVDGYVDDGSELAPFINQDYVDDVMSYASKYAGGPASSGPAGGPSTASMTGGISPIALVGIGLLAALALISGRR